MAVHVADQLAYDRATVTKPVWNHFDTAASALGLEENILLHAGPSFDTVSNISMPIMNSACVAAVYEGLADDFDQAKAMIEAEEIILKPAQDFSVVTPLAAVVSASMPLHGVYDAHHGQVRVFAPINGGARPSLRLGLKSEAVLEHIKWLNGPFFDILQGGLAEGIELIPLAVAGVINDDDCHGRTPYATQLLVEELSSRTPGGIQDEDALDFMHSSPSLFLNLWMAATKCIMQVCSGITNSSLITAAGGNGIDVGVQLSGLPGQWFTAPATAPQGKFDLDLPADRALGAIGDSAIIDCFGLGAMAIDKSQAQFSAMSECLPADHEQRLKSLKVGPYPDFRELKLTLGITARQIVNLNLTPMIALGILDRLGEQGRLGGGIYDMPAEPFVMATSTLNETSAS